MDIHKQSCTSIQQCHEECHVDIHKQSCTSIQQCHEGCHVDIHKQSCTSICAAWLVLGCAGEEPLRENRQLTAGQPTFGAHFQGFRNFTLLARQTGPHVRSKLAPSFKKRREDCVLSTRGYTPCVQKMHISQHSLLYWPKHFHTAPAYVCTYCYTVCQTILQNKYLLRGACYKKYKLMRSSCHCLCRCLIYIFKEEHPLLQLKLDITPSI